MRKISKSNTGFKNRSRKFKDFTDVTFSVNCLKDICFPVIIKLDHLLNLVKDQINVISINRDQICIIYTNYTCGSGSRGSIGITDIKKIIIHFVVICNIPDTGNRHLTLANIGFW